MDDVDRQPQLVHRLRVDLQQTTVAEHFFAFKQHTTTGVAKACGSGRLVGTSAHVAKIYNLHGAETRMKMYQTFSSLCRYKRRAQLSSHKQGTWLPGDTCLELFAIQLIPGRARKDTGGVSMQMWR